MKTLKLIIPLLLLSVCMAAQVPQSFNYQAVVRDADNKPVTNETVDFTITILQNGEVIYEEDHLNEDTGELGLVNFKVGDGEVITGDFPQIDWSLGNLQIRTTLNGEPDPIGIADIVPVPSALYAESSGDDGDWEVDGDNVYRMNGNVGIGISVPEEELEIGGTVNIKGGGHYKLDFYSSGPSEESFIRSFDENENHLWAIIMGDRDDNDKFKIDIPWNGEQEFVIDKAGKVGIGTYSPKDRLEVVGAIRVTGDDFHGKLRMDAASSTQDNRIVSYDENGDLMWWVFMGDRDNDDNYVIDRPGNGTRDFYIDSGATTHVRVLQIHGGSDINEDFNSIDQLKPGDVVVIDENNPGQVKRTDKPYDSKAIGIISGANGVNPGLSLSQEDVLEGEYPLAMLGRVYVKVTGKVEVGDMLTTSAIPGYAMAVKEYERSLGAIIGKAMTASEQNKGYVLVMVNLQ